MLYTRGFRGVMNTQLIRSNYTEAWTTTTHPEIMQLCMDVPIEKRLNYEFYKKWIITHYHEAARYKWEKTGGLITEGKVIGFIRKLIYRGPNKLKRMLGHSKNIASGMNPLDYWVEHNSEARQFLERYEQDGYSSMPQGTSDQLVADMKELFKVGTVNERTMVMTVLSTAKLYFGDVHGESIA